VSTVILLSLVLMSLALCLAFGVILFIMMTEVDPILWTT
jgi:hypothetical protein